ncbi:MAG: leucine-rich repeat domain-containing protein [Bacteroidaceae bacterium]|nr:leucine-rich repeat domain-containing protein [Bacteroidaceae bacterium]
MKKLNLLFAALMLVCCVGMAKAEEVTIDGIKYDVVTKAKLATVISGGNYSGDIIIPSEITHNNVVYSVTSIGDGAFKYCRGLTSITIPNSVTSIGNYAFYECSGLTSITIPNSVTFIGNYAFSFCTGLTSVIIGNSVTSIGEWAFKGCTRLTSITIPNSVTRIKTQAFYNCSGLTSIVIGNSVTSIGYLAFYNCSGLTSIEIPNSVTNIVESAFEDCTGLTSITIPNSVRFIGNDAFSGCTRLTSVTIGTGVKEIGSEAFAKCSNLTDVYCLATSVPSTYSDAFNESYPEYMTLHVPEEAINSYKATAPWSSFGTVVTLDGTETPKCATPTVSYSDGKLLFECETEGAEFITDVTCSDIKKFYDSEIAFSATYNISVYATATGYENSDIVNATLCWIECECDGGDYTNVIDIPAKAVLVTSSNGSINISCSLDGESVAVYTTAGTLIATTTIENGTATVATGLSKGSVAIVNIAGKSIKVAVN